MTTNQDPDAVSRDASADVALATTAHRDLLTVLDRRIAEDSLDVAAPSRLPGWTRGHVITHLTNSGDGHVRLFRAAAAGDVGVQYPNGVDGRAADIDAGSGRLAADQVADLRRSIAELEQLWASSTWDGTGRLMMGVAPIVELPFLRMREVAIHHVDLDIGYEFADLPATYLRAELGRMEMLWKARQPMGLTPLPQLALTAPPPERLAWLMGRTRIEGLPAADVF